ncbi:hypothetical protein SAMN06265365_107175 [Tistlia consotensis]|uniref:Uncharacterized protein n=1 Tax=Tistlia consotensis USBA 355 TaxID=560819 RepID=A0A1Y6B8J7_9PROT|nr:hypothetical protein [Tistlia consotensis]SME98499.1 hypothetical protein SAMN05428998_102177 [Tistlia consotensis USBA 355]SNR57877.1 hypothetical protein SAMN06265365_107175 [Tistlia consotensis]
MAGSDGLAKLPQGLRKLADRLLALDEAVQGSQRELRRVSARVEAANARRRRLLPLAAALLRRQHRDQLAEVGATPFDLAEAAVDTPYDGLLVALAGAARTAGSAPGSILLLGAAREAGEPALAAEVLGLPLRAADATAEAVESAAGQPLAAVAGLGELLAGAALRGALGRRAVLLVVLLDPTDPAGPQALREAARRLVEALAAEGLEALHVSGAGDQVAFARRGLLAPGRSDGFPAPAAPSAGA